MTPLRGPFRRDALVSVVCPSATEGGPSDLLVMPGMAVPAYVQARRVEECFGAIDGVPISDVTPEALALEGVVTLVTTEGMTGHPALHEMLGDEALRAWRRLGGHSVPPMVVRGPILHDIGQRNSPWYACMRGLENGTRPTQAPATS
jgi:hypothetical protein